MQISDELRQSVIQSLPELNEIRDDALRQKVIDAWAYSLGQSSFTSIDEIPASGNPDTPPMTSGTQTDHIRGVARLAIGMGDALAGQLPHLPINRDLLVACALCHDVGKPYEFDPQNQQRWRDNPATSGLPAIRHPQYGTHACLTAGLPEEADRDFKAHFAWRPPVALTPLVRANTPRLTRNTPRLTRNTPPGAP
jgi:23S rRNA maturation-related 3'-5' exoribonuclease YhaM